MLRGHISDHRGGGGSGGKSVGRVCVLVNVMRVLVNVMRGVMLGGYISDHRSGGSGGRKPNMV